MEFSRSRRPPRRFAAVACVLTLAAVALQAQRSQVVRPIDPSRRMVLKGNVDPRALARYDRGAVPPGFPVHYARMLLRPSAAQQADLEQFLTDQQNSASPFYHRWLTPEQFADRFGVSAADASRVAAWLRTEGLAVHDIARGRLWITFSGTARQVGAAFRTEIHRYRTGAESHFANATPPSVPEALAAVVRGIDGLTDFALKPVAIARKIAGGEHPDFNTSGGLHLLAPDDLGTIYNIAALRATGVDGSGQKIAVVGASTIDLSDIRAFRRRFNLPSGDPQLVLVGGNPGVDPDSQIEANLDLEWAAAAAPQATLVYAYARDVTLAASYVVDHALAQVLSMSFGACEQEISPVLQSIAQQANAEGITWVAASGDSGAAGCDAAFTHASASKGFAVSYPASLPEVTAVGGTQFDEADGTYWAAANSSNLASALSYIPEAAWNETGSSSGGLAATGGGASVLFPKPVWQSGPGVPADNARDVPDVSLSAGRHDGYYVISGGSAYAVSGTSASTPVFAGVVALLSQSLGQPGLGNINPMLYRLGRNASAVFHDIVFGSNTVPCIQSSPNCGMGSFGYQAGPGYDLATGWGSVDAFNLVAGWSGATAGTTTLSLSVDPASADWGGTAQMTATVKATSGGGTPGGTVVFLWGLTKLGETSLAGSDGMATATLALSVGQLGVGAQTITAVYGGDGDFNGSSGTATVHVTVPGGASAVTATVSPNPVFEVPADSNGSQWFVTMRLTEVAGTPTTLTSFSIDGVDHSSEIANLFGTASIPAKGTLIARLGTKTVPSLPWTRQFQFGGVDAGGRQWSQQASTVFEGPLLNPAMTLASAPALVYKNTDGSAPCQWSQLVTLQEQNGFAVDLIGFRAGSNIYTGQIQQLFGTTHLAPFGALQATLCWNGQTAPQTKSYEIDGFDDRGAPVSASATAAFADVPPGTTALSVDQPAVTMIAGADMHASAAVAVNVSAGLQWTVSIFPSNRTTTWLSVSPGSGAASSALSLQASATGLANGVYHATLLVQAPGATPQVVEVPVTFVVGASPDISIGGVSNGASYQTGFAPGMEMSVFGTGLAPAAQAAAVLPLPLSMQGVTATVNGIPAPLYYVSPVQLNIQIPYETGAGTAVLGVNNNGHIAAFSFQVAAAAPGIFTDANRNLVPSGTGARGQVLLLYVTGEGDLTPSLLTGAPPSSGTPVASLPKPKLAATLTIGNVPAQIQFIGIPPGLVGVTQVNFVVPADAPLGPQPVVLTVGGVASQEASLTVTP